MTKYEKSPLNHVICEIQFRPQLSIDTKKDLLYKKFCDIFPNIQFGGFQQNNSLPQNPITFTNPSEGLILGIDRFAFFQNKYTGHKNFHKSFLNYLTKFNDVINFSAITRLGLRYINLIPFTRNSEKAIVPFEDFFNIDIKLPTPLSTDFENLDLNFVSKTINGNITTKIAVLAKGSESEAFILDIDSAVKKEDMKIKNSHEFLSTAHIQSHQVFDNILTQKYIDYLKGESLC